MLHLLFESGCNLGNIQKPTLQHRGRSEGDRVCGTCSISYWRPRPPTWLSILVEREGKKKKEPWCDLFEAKLGRSLAFFRHSAGDLKRLPKKAERVSHFAALVHLWRPSVFARPHLSQEFCHRVRRQHLFSLLYFLPPPSSSLFLPFPV